MAEVSRGTQPTLLSLYSEEEKESFNVRVPILAVLSLISVVGNCCSLQRILFGYEVGGQIKIWQRKSSPVFLNLIIADLLVTIFSMIGQCLWESYGWYGTNSFCKYVKFMQTFSISLSNYMLVAIGTDRFNAIRKPLQHSRTSTRTILIAWLVALVPSLPTCFVFTLDLGEYDCVSNISAWPIGLRKAYFSGIGVLVFLAPFVSLVTLYSLILRRLWREVRRERRMPALRPVSDSPRHSADCESMMISEPCTPLQPTQTILQTITPLQSPLDNGTPFHQPIRTPLQSTIQPILHSSTAHQSTVQSPLQSSTPIQSTIQPALQTSTAPESTIQSPIQTSTSHQSSTAPQSTAQPPLQVVYQEPRPKGQLKPTLSGNQERMQFYSQAMTKTTYLSISIVVLFTITNLPYIVFEFVRQGILVNYSCEDGWCVYLQDFVALSIVFNSALNPYVFLFFHSTSARSDACLNSWLPHTRLNSMRSTFSKRSLATRNESIDPDQRQALQEEMGLGPNTVKKY